MRKLKRKKNICLLLFTAKVGLVEHLSVTIYSLKVLVFIQYTDSGIKEGWFCLGMNLQGQ